jgi:integrase
MGLGSYPEVSLAEARETARGLRKQVRDGFDPLTQRQQGQEAARRQRNKAKTFRECAEVVIANKGRELKNPKDILLWASSIEIYAYPVIGNMIVGDITKADIVAVLEPIWEAKNVTASRLRCRIENVLDYAKAMEYREGENPAAWKAVLEPILGKVKREKKPQPSLPYSEIGAFIAELRKRDEISARALEFLILTATRTGETVGATWDEFDLQSKIWSIPAKRMKAAKPHRVPLSEGALRVLQQLPRIQGTPYVFPAPRTEKLTDVSFFNLIKRIHESALKEGGKGFIDPKQNRIVTTHGFRSTFRDWAAEQTHYPREVCEHALAHQLPDAVEAAYLRTDFLERRTRLMEEWAAFCG